MSILHSNGWWIPGGTSYLVQLRRNTVCVTKKVTKVTFYYSLCTLVLRKPPEPPARCTNVQRTSPNHLPYLFYPPMAYTPFGLGVYPNIHPYTPFWVYMMGVYGIWVYMGV